MPRYRLILEYDGGPYNGLQAQAGQPSVQASVERAVAAFCGESVRMHAAGRTDSGVHATGQDAHLSPEPIVVLDACVAPPDFHARFSATERRYLYRILNRRSPPGLDRGRVWHVRKPLDAAAMRDAAQVLLGRHDFTTFRDLACQAKSPVKTLDTAEVARNGEEVGFRFAARSFLHRQVRSMVGSLVEVGVGRWSPEAFRAAFEARDRRACGPVAPASGLYLVDVKY
jgi:tRNA pseudouridine38-40 synthase